MCIFSLYLCFVGHDYFRSQESEWKMQGKYIYVVKTTILACFSFSSIFLCKAVSGSNSVQICCGNPQIVHSIPSYFVQKEQSTKERILHLKICSKKHLLCHLSSKIENKRTALHSIKIFCIQSLFVFCQ